MSARVRRVLSVWIVLTAVVACAETADRSKMLTHPLNVVGPAESKHAGSSTAVDHSKALTHPLNVVGPAEKASASSPVATEVSVRLTQEGGTKAVSLAVGQKLAVMVAGNPSTGYQWELTGPVAGAALVQEGRGEFVAGATDLVGAPGEYRFVFKAAGHGTTSISLKYVRPWEQNKPPAATATVSVTVTK